MSNAVQGMVWGLDVAMSHKIVLLKMADCANDDGDGVWLAVENIARQCGCTGRHVQNVLRTYTESGVLAVEAEPYDWVYKGRAMPTTLYRFDLAALQSVPPAPTGADTTDADSPAGIETAEIPAIDQQEGEPHSPSTLGEGEQGSGVNATTREGEPHSPKPSENPHERKKKNKSKKERKPADGIMPGEIETFLAAMPRVDLPDDARCEYIRARNAGASAETLLDAARCYARATVDREVKFIKDAAKWLAGGGHKVAAGNGGANGSAPPPIAAEGVPDELVKAWKQVRARMWSGNGADNYRSWIRPLVLTGTEDGFAVVEAPSQTAVDWVAAQYGRQLDAEWREAAGIGVRITGPTQAALTRTGT